MTQPNPMLVRSFALHKGTRGAHFYDSEKCEFVEWSAVVADIRNRLPEAFYEKLIEAIANYDPNSEFISVSAGEGQITIELFKAETM